MDYNDKARFLLIRSSVGTQTVYDRTLDPVDGDLGVYRPASGGLRASIATARKGELTVEVCGVIVPTVWLDVVGVAVDIQPTA